MRINSCCASGSEVACHEETGGTYTVLRDNSNYWACGEERGANSTGNAGILNYFRPSIYPGIDFARGGTSTVIITS